VSDEQNIDHCDAIELEYDFDEPVQKVWRAISIKDYRELWLPNSGSVTEPDKDSIVLGEKLSYRIRESHPPFVESVVTFHLSPNDHGGTNLRIIHRISTSMSTNTVAMAANNNDIKMMLAA